MSEQSKCPNLDQAFVYAEMIASWPPEGEPSGADYLATFLLRAKPEIAALTAEVARLTSLLGYVREEG